MLSPPSLSSRAMAGKEVLRPWVLEALATLNGHGTPVEVSRIVWELHEDELRDSGDLFFTWQYDIRWAAQQLRDSGELRPVNGDRQAPWQLA